MSDITIKTNVLGVAATNCYFIINEQSREVIITDPGQDAQTIKNNCAKQGLAPAAVLLTHGHFDHILAAKEIKEAYKIPICAGVDEQALLGDAKQNCSAMFGTSAELAADILLKDGDVLEQAGININVISTPGHTAGSLCYYIKEENILLSGDTLFNNGLGRTDLPTGDYNTLVNSIKTKLFVLPEETLVYPGHGKPTKIGYETRYCLY